jgi:hypothetical protein
MSVILAVLRICLEIKQNLLELLFLVVDPGIHIVALSTAVLIFCHEKKLL